MATVGSFEVNRISPELLERVSRGQSITITEQHRGIALRIIATNHWGSGSEGRWPALLP